MAVYVIIIATWAVNHLLYMYVCLFMCILICCFVMWVKSDALWSGTFMFTCCVIPHGLVFQLVPRCDCVGGCRETGSVVCTV